MSAKLKKVLKPLIKECIKEIIFEDGVLSSIIREAQGTPTKQVVKEEKPFTKSDKGIDITNIPGMGKWGAINERLSDG